MVRAYLSLGSNLGNRKTYLKQAVKAISLLSGTFLQNVSSIYETPPWGLLEQPAFLNICIAIDTNLEPAALLSCCLGIEKKSGRKRDIHWGPRVLDIDILTYGDLKINERGLTLPHPFMTERAFVLKPLAEIAPTLFFNSVSINEIMSKLDIVGILNVGKLDL